MTATDRIAALEREVAELSEYIRQLQRTNTALGEIMRGVPPMPAPIPDEFRVLTCPVCGVRGLVGSWHACSGPVNSYTVGGRMLCQSCGQLTVVGSWHTCASTLINTGGTS